MSKNKYVVALLKFPGAGYGTIPATIDNKANLERSFTNIVAWAEGETPEEAMKAANQLIQRDDSRPEVKMGVAYDQIDTKSLQVAISKFSLLDPLTATDDEIVKAFRMIILHISGSLCSYNHEEVFFRARRCDEDGPYQNKSDIWYPPCEFKDKKTGTMKKLPMGRLNREGESIFYTSLLPNALMAELRLEQDECFYFMKYKVKKGGLLFLAPIGLDERLDEFPGYDLVRIDQSTWSINAKHNYDLIVKFLSMNLLVK